MATSKPTLDHIETNMEIAPEPDNEKPGASMTNSNGLVLVPQPSNDPRDPLNWSTVRKLVFLATVCFAGFVATLQAMCNISGFVPQALLYHRPVVDLSYSVSAAVAGLAVGPFVWAPFARSRGKCATLFWSAILGIACNIWSACMVKPSQYDAFIVSRMFSGLLGSGATTVGAKIITELFFLHDRGKCLTVYSTSILLGITAASTFSGFIAQATDWTIQFWYTVALQGAVALLVVLVMDETGWARSQFEQYPIRPAGFLAKRAALYLGTQRVTPIVSWSEAVRLSLLPCKIAFCPSVIIVGVAIFIYFAWNVAVSTLLAIFLQEPLKAGGYGFSPNRNAAFSFDGWVAIFAAQVYGHFVNDRLPLWLCTRRGGEWHAEYRLHALWAPVFVALPLGCGLFGACVHYHWHYMVLALGFFLIQFGAIAGVAPAVNYVVESIGRSMANECTVALNCYRLTLGLVIPFFLFQWADQVGIQWVFGSMAFLTIFAFGMLVMLMSFGQKIRSWDFVRESSQEDGVKLVQTAKRG